MGEIIVVPVFLNIVGLPFRQKKRDRERKISGKGRPGNFMNTF
jgi:hypothetical protein